MIFEFVPVLKWPFPLSSCIRNIAQQEAINQNSLNHAMNSRGQIISRGAEDSSWKLKGRRMVRVMKLEHPIRQQQITLIPVPRIAAPGFYRDWLYQQYAKEQKKVLYI